MDPVIESFSEPIFEEFISHIYDPRVQGRCLHRLTDIMVIGFCATLCGAEGFTEIEDWAIDREDWLRRFLELPNGIPSHDTFLRVFSLVDPREFEAAFMAWAQSVSVCRHEHISLDGKSVTYANDKMPYPLHLVNVYAHDAGVFLGQLRARHCGSAEVPTVEDSLDFFDLEGSLISVDAANATRRIAAKVLEKEADYLFPVKGNLRALREMLKEEFKQKVDAKSCVESIEEGHGRFDTRSARVLNFKSSDYLPHVQTIIEIKRERKQLVRSTQVEKPAVLTTTYYASSRKLTALEALYLIQQHWKIESSLHWILDVALLEDQCRVRAKIAAENLSLLRKLAINVLKKDTTPNKSIRRKMKLAGWSREYFESLIFTKALA